MTILSCYCDVEKACTMHADEIYNRETETMNDHVHPTFQNILNDMVARISEPSIPVTIDQLRQMLPVCTTEDCGGCLSCRL
jgi:hypothetical protein